MVSSQIELAARKCKPCEGGTPPMTEKEAKVMLTKVEGWELRENKIRKTYRLKDFKESMKFVNKVGILLKRRGIIQTYSYLGTR